MTVWPKTPRPNRPAENVGTSNFWMRMRGTRGAHSADCPRHRCATDERVRWKPSTDPAHSSSFKPFLPVLILGSLIQLTATGSRVADERRHGRVLTPDNVRPVGCRHRPGHELHPVSGEFNRSDVRLYGADSSRCPWVCFHTCALWLSLPSIH